MSVTTSSGEHLIALLAITSQAPLTVGTSVEIPVLELRRAGLASHARGWVIISEFNTDIVERSWYFAPKSKRGAFSPTFLRRILDAFRPTLASRSAAVDRQA